MAAGARAALGNVAIVGSGNVGTMLGVALRAAAGPEVHEIGIFDRDPVVARDSFDRGSADRILASEDEVVAADTIVLCVPVPEIVRLVTLWGPRLLPGTFLIDTGSAKAKVVEAMRALPEHVHALGGHPMVGTHLRGPEGARPELLQNAPFILTPVRADVASLERGRALAHAVAARPVEMDARTHDHATAVTSHVPHVAAFVLASLARSRGHAQHLASTGLAAATRLAASDPEMVGGFLWANASEVRLALRDFIDVLEWVVSRLDDPEAITHVLSDLVTDRGHAA